MEGFIGILTAILLFGLMIFVHEFGHFITARLCGVTVEEFAIGMGPKIFSKKSKKSGTVYSVRLLPLGGFTNMLGENDDVGGDPHAFSNRPCWQRLVILCAGSFMNVLTAIIAMFIVVSSAAAYYNTTVAGFLSEDAASYKAGLRVGDTITAVNNTRVNVYSDIVYTVMREGIEPCTLTVDRGGETVKIENVSFPTETQDNILMGDVDFRMGIEYKSFPVVVKQAVSQSFATIKLVYQSLLDLITGRYGIESVSGPVGAVSEISKVAADTAKTNNYSMLIFLFAMLSMNVGVMNLLPIPARDGGRIIFVLIEMIRRKPVKQEYEAYIHMAGMAVLLIFMGVVTVLDIMKMVK